MTLWLAVFLGLARAEPPRVFKSGPDRVSLLELYSSEGCSSCPPADEWLSSLTGAEGLWTDFIPVAFQVDYWDRLGWKDPLSSPEFTARQQSYANFWQKNSVYTPGLVLNGKEFRGWGEAPPAKLAEKGGTLAVASDGPLVFAVSYAPSGKTEKKYIAHAALLVFGLKSRVAAGENEGKTLRHDFAAVDLEDAALDGGKARLRLRKKLALAANRYGAAFWITAGDDPTPLQVVGGYLP
jgi:hypothetical protein